MTERRDCCSGVPLARPPACSTRRSAADGKHQHGQSRRHFEKPAVVRRQIRIRKATPFERCVQPYSNTSSQSCRQIGVMKGNTNYSGNQTDSLTRFFIEAARFKARGCGTGQTARSDATSQRQAASKCLSVNLNSARSDARHVRGVTLE